MLVHVPALLDAATLARVRALVFGGPWADGKMTAGTQSAQAKNNRQLPEDCAAAAVFFTTGSVAPPDVTPVPPPAGIDRTLVGNAVALAAAANPQHFEALAGAYIAQGLEVVKQFGGWDKAIAIARDHFQAQQERHLRSSKPPAGGPPVTQHAER